MVFLPQHTNQALFVQELQRRNIQVDTIDTDIELIQCVYKDHNELIVDRYSTLHSYALVTLMADKFISKHLMSQYNITTPQGALFDCSQINDILHYIDNTIHYPIVIKPNRGSHGEHIAININGPVACKQALEQLQSTIGGETPCIIEQYISGQEYRIFITKEKNIACLLLEPAYVIGDGIHTIEDLVLYENSYRQTREQYALYPIVIDEMYIQKQGFTMEYVPSANQRIYVRQNSNVATGGVTTDYTDTIHPEYIDICYKALCAFPGLMYAGVDIITHDIRQEPTKDSYAVIEINSNPSFSIHHRPKYGNPRNVSAMVADMLFPETILHHDS